MCSLIFSWCSEVSIKITFFLRIIANYNLIIKNKKRLFSQNTKLHNQLNVIFLFSLWITHNYENMIIWNGCNIQSHENYGQMCSKLKTPLYEVSNTIELIIYNITFIWRSAQTSGNSFVYINELRSFSINLKNIFRSIESVSRNTFDIYLTFVL